MKRRVRDIIGHDVEALSRALGRDDAAVEIAGHGYGGVVALHFAVRYPRRVASLTLYEPADLISLFDDGLLTAEARQVRRLHDIVVGQSGHAFGRWRGAREFVRFWLGRGAWKRLGARRKAGFVAALPRLAARMDALMSAEARIADASALNMPVTIRCRRDAPRPLRRIGEVLQARLPNARLECVDGADHAVRFHVAAAVYAGPGTATGRCVAVAS